MTGAPLRTKSSATATVQVKLHDQRAFSQDDWPEVLMLYIIITVIVFILLSTARQIESFSQGFSMKCQSCLSLPMAGPPLLNLFIQAGKLLTTANRIRIGVEPI